MKGRGGRRSKQLLDSLKERRGYCELKKQELDRTLWKTGFQGVYGPFVRQITE